MPGSYMEVLLGSQVETKGQKHINILEPDVSHGGLLGPTYGHLARTEIGSAHKLPSGFSRDSKPYLPLRRFVDKPGG